MDGGIECTVSDGRIAESLKTKEAEKSRALKELREQHSLQMEEQELQQSSALVEMQGKLTSMEVRGILVPPLVRSSHDHTL